MDEIEDFSNFRFEDFDTPGSTETMIDDAVDTDIRLPNGAALAVVDADQAVRDYLASQLGEGVATVASLVMRGSSDRWFTFVTAIPSEWIKLAVAETARRGC